MEDIILKQKSIVASHQDSPERFEMALRAAYEAALNLGDIAFDIGAHTGKHSIPMAKCVGRNGQIYAFEPIIEKLITIAQKSEYNGISWITTLNLACSDETGMVTFNYLPTDAGKSSIHLRDRLNKIENTILKRNVLCVKIDDMFKNPVNVNFIQIDAEGAEYHILKGLSNTIKLHKPIIHFESGKETLSLFGAKALDLWALITNLGYDVYDIAGNRIKEYNTFNISMEKCIIYDYICIPAGDARAHSVINSISNVWQK